MVNLKTNFSFLITIIIVVVLMGCQKDNDSMGAFDKSKSTKLLINVVGVENVIPLVASNSNASKVEEVQISKINEDIDYSTSYDVSSIAEQNIQSKLNVSKQYTKASTSLGNDITYRFVLFVKNGDKYDYVGHKDGTKNSSNESLEFEAYTGKSYKWVAYSYNNNQVIADNISSSSLAIQTAIDKDLLYASDTVSVNDNQDKAINIRLKHRLARIAITLKADEYPAVIPDNLSKNADAKLAVKLVGESVNYFKKGSFNILDNLISNVSSVSYTDNLPFAPQTNSLGDPIRVAYLYTADMVSNLDPLILEVQNLQLTVNDPHTFRDADYPVILKETITINALNNVIPNSGFSYSPTINFKSYGPGVVRNGCVLWANGDLSYIPADASRQQPATYINNYSVNPGTRSTENEYWMFNSITPWDIGIEIKGTAHESSNVWTIDPCRQLELNKTISDSKYQWRMPSEKEVLNLAIQGDAVPSAAWRGGPDVTFNADKSKTIIPNDYVSFKLDGGRWVTFYKTGAINIQDYDNRTNLSKWTLDTDDSSFIPVYNSTRGVVNSYPVIHIDGEGTKFKKDTKDKKEKMPIRCVQTYNISSCSSYVVDYSEPK